MASEIRSWTRQGEAFWRAHHEAWKRSDLNQRQYCEAEGIPPKAFGNWRAKFKAEPQPAERKLLYRRRGLSHPLSPPLSHPLSHPLSQLTYPSSWSGGPIVPRPRKGHRRRFSEADKRRILEEAAQGGASVAACPASLAFCLGWGPKGSETMAESLDARRIARDQESRIAAAASVGFNAAKPLFQYQTAILRLWADNFEMLARHYENGVEAFTTAIEQQHNQARQQAAE